MTSITIGRAFAAGLTFFAVSIAGAVTVTACGGSDDTPKVGNGVNDVHAACVIRASWVATDQNQCDICAAAVVSPRCGCSELTAFSGACDSQAQAQQAACPQAVNDCVNGCKAGDCNCVDGCYANNPSCKAASAARDGCQADACTQYCK